MTNPINNTSLTRATGSEAIQGIYSILFSQRASQKAARNRRNLEVLIKNWMMEKHPRVDSKLPWINECFFPSRKHRKIVPSMKQELNFFHAQLYLSKALILVKQ